jgi:hypothetical protein
LLFNYYVFLQFVLLFFHFLEQKRLPYIHINEKDSVGLPQRGSTSGPRPNENLALLENFSASLLNLW